MKSIASALRIAPSTVKTLIARIKEKLELPGDHEDFVRAAIEANAARARSA